MEQKYKILVVEDDKEIREGVEKNKKILKNLKKCVDKLKRLVYNKLTKTNSHR